MGVIRWLIGGLICGAVGAFAWILVASFTHYEIGWLAWGIGFIVGVGVRYGAYLGDEDESDMQGIVAAAIAGGSIVLAKFILFMSFTIDNGFGETRVYTNNIRYDELAMVAQLADEFVEAKVAAGETIPWPAGMTFDQARDEQDYPPEIWNQAQQSWNSLPPQQQEALVSERVQLIAELQNDVRIVGPSFGEFFSPWDILWFGLALVTAYKVGAGTYGADD